MRRVVARQLELAVLHGHLQGAKMRQRVGARRWYHPAHASVQRDRCGVTGAAWHTARRGGVRRGNMAASGVRRGGGAVVCGMRRAACAACGVRRAVCGVWRSHLEVVDRLIELAKPRVDGAQVVMNVRVLLVDLGVLLLDVAERVLVVVGVGK